MNNNFKPTKAYRDGASAMRRVTCGFIDPRLEAKAYMRERGKHLPLAEKLALAREFETGMREEFARKGAD